MIKLISWNIGRRADAWRMLLDSDADVALLQEASAPPADVAGKIKVDPAPWFTAGADRNRPWRAALVKLSEGASVDWLPTSTMTEAVSNEIRVSQPGTLVPAIVTPSSGEPVTVVSMYALWEKPHHVTGSGWIYADGSAHRLISDLSALVGQQMGHRILAAGDLNILHGYGEYGSSYWAERYATVFSRMSALGIPFIY